MVFGALCFELLHCLAGAWGRQVEGSGACGSLDMFRFRAQEEEFAKVFLGCTYLDLPRETGEPLE